MRSIGSLLIFLVLTWIGLGFLLSDNINTHQTLVQVQQQVNQAIKEKNAALDQLAKAVTDKNTALDQLANAVANLNALQQQNQALQAQLKQIQGENQGLKSQKADLENQLDGMKKNSTLAETLIRALNQPLMLGLFIPILPASLVTSYVVYRYGQGRRARKHNQENKPRRIVSVNVTEQEMQQIVKMRRGQQ